MLHFHRRQTPDVGGGFFGGGHEVRRVKTTLGRNWNLCDVASPQFVEHKSVSGFRHSYYQV